MLLLLPIKVMMTQVAALQGTVAVYDPHTVTREDGLRALESGKLTIGGAVVVVDDYDAIPNLYMLGIFKSYVVILHSLISQAHEPLLIILRLQYNHRIQSFSLPAHSTTEVAAWVEIMPQGDDLTSTIGSA